MRVSFSDIQYDDLFIVDINAKHKPVPSILTGEFWSPSIEDDEDYPIDEHTDSAQLSYKTFKKHFGDVGETWTDADGEEHTVCAIELTSDFSKHVAAHVVLRFMSQYVRDYWCIDDAYEDISVERYIFTRVAWKTEALAFLTSLKRRREEAANNVQSDSAG